MNRSRFSYVVVMSILFSVSASAQLAVTSHPTVPPLVLAAFEEGIHAELPLLFYGIHSDSGKLEIAASQVSVSRPMMQGTFDTLRWKAPGLRVWVAFPSLVDHWHHYTVVELKGQVYKLGGFSTPEVAALDEALGTNQQAQLERALLLAALLDPNGADSLKVSHRARIRLPTGDIVVFVTTESFQLNHFRPRWMRFQYSFLFDPGGRLKDWSRFNR